MATGESDSTAHIFTEAATLGTEYAGVSTNTNSSGACTNTNPSAGRKIYLVIFNISKRTNVRSLLCTAAAFGCHGVFVVGQRSFNLDPDGKDVPTPIKDFIRDNQGMIVQHFDKWNNFVEYLQQQSIQLIGVEIHADAKPVDHYLTNTLLLKLKTLPFSWATKGRD